MTLLSTWWGEPDQFEWITTFLRERRMLGSARLVMAIVAGSSALVPLTVLPSQCHPSIAEVILGLVADVFTVGMTVFWLRRWPTRRQSQVGVMIGAACISGWSLAQPTAALAALPCTALAVTGGYIAFFHSPRLLAVNGAVALAITIPTALRLAHEANIATAVSAFWVINFLNVSVPVAIWGMTQAIGRYAQRSDQDALTGLLNRRAFTETVTRRVADPPRAHTHLAMVMVDLDNFKRVNDTHGHAAGDRALRAVAAALREHAPAHAVICRAGGEEFLVAVTTVNSDVKPLAAQFCAAVAGLSPAVTASVGTASAPLQLLTGPDGGCLIEQLVTTADNAMYTAKRNGGNQVWHSQGRCAMPKLVPPQHNQRLTPSEVNGV